MSNKNKYTQIMQSTEMIFDFHFHQTLFLILTLNKLHIFNGFKYFQKEVPEVYDSETSSPEQSVFSSSWGLTKETI